MQKHYSRDLPAFEREPNHSAFGAIAEEIDSDTFRVSIDETDEGIEITDGHIAGKRIRDRRIPLPKVWLDPGCAVENRDLKILAQKLHAEAVVVPFAKRRLCKKQDMIHRHCAAKTVTDSLRYCSPPHTTKPMQNLPLYLAERSYKLVRLGISLLPPTSYRPRYERYERSKERPEDEPK